MPTAEATDRWRDGLRAEIDGGARFLQTQVCHNLDVVRRYAEPLQAEGFTGSVSVLINNGPLASARSAVWMRANLWGVLIPDDIVACLEQANDPRAEGIEICCEQILAMSEIPGIASAQMIAPTNPASIPETLADLAIPNRS